MSVIEKHVHAVVVLVNVVMGFWTVELGDGQASLLVGAAH